MRSAMSVLLEKAAFWRPRKPLACGPKQHPSFRTSNGCPTSYDTRGSKRLASLRDWQELDAERAVSRVRSICLLKKVLGERGLESEAVGTRLCRATLACGVRAVQDQ